MGFGKYNGSDQRKLVNRIYNQERLLCYHRRILKKHTIKVESLKRSIKDNKAKLGEMVHDFEINQRVKKHSAFPLPVDFGTKSTALCIQRKKR